MRKRKHGCEVFRPVLPTPFQTQTAMPVPGQNNPCGIAAMWIRPTLEAASINPENARIGFSILLIPARGSTSRKRGQTIHINHPKKSPAHSSRQGSPVPSCPILQAGSVFLLFVPFHRRQRQHIQSGYTFLAAFQIVVDNTDFQHSCTPSVTRPRPAHTVELIQQRIFSFRVILKEVILEIAGRF